MCFSLSVVDSAPFDIGLHYCHGHTFSEFSLINNLDVIFVLIKKWSGWSCDCGSSPSCAFIREKKRGGGRGVLPKTSLDLIMLKRVKSRSTPVPRKVLEQELARYLIPRSVDFAVSFSRGEETFPQLPPLIPRCFCGPLMLSFGLSWREEQFCFRLTTPAVTTLPSKGVCARSD